MPAIDYDKGVLKRKHPAGLDVYMYVNEPGVFRNGHGNEVDKELAREAGYEVDRLVKERRRRARVAEATKMIDEEFSHEVAHKVVDTVNGYKIVQVNGERHTILDPDNNVMTPGKFLSRSEARRIAKMMTAAEEVPEEKAPEEQEQAQAEGE